MNKLAIFKIRLIQIKRQFDSLGIIYSLLVIFTLVAVLYFSFVGYNKSVTAWYITSSIIGFVLLIHLSRRDLAFVQRQIKYPVQNIYFEYVLLLLPFYFHCLFIAQWYHVLVLLATLFLISLLRINHSTKTILPKLSLFISSTNFEWLSGVRQYTLQLFVFTILAIATCWIKIVPLVFLWILTSIVSSFYYECESIQLLLATESSAKQFLKLKVLSHSKILLTVFLPILIINSIIHTDAIWINLAFIIVMLSFLLFTIYLKYSVYSPSDDLKHNSVLIAFTYIGVLIPFLLPVSFIMCIRNYKLAVKKLNYYFND